MSIASAFFSRKPIVLLIAISLAGCSGDLGPSVGIDGDSTVNAIKPSRNVGSGMRADPNSVAAYPAADMPLTTTSGNTESFGGVQTSGVGEPPVASQAARQLPMIDSDEALGADGVVQASAAGGVLRVPEDGVNMDAGLGVQPVQGLAEAQAEEIAEGNATQVVVDGIGTEAPQQVGQPMPMPGSVPMTEAADEVGRSAPAKGAPVDEEQQVAFIPRFNDPMAVPESHGGMPASEKACRQRLQRLGVKFREIPTISKGRSCGIPYPIELQSLSGGIQIRPAAQVNCQITEAFAKWVKNELAPSARMRYLSGVRSIHQMSSYSCRTMNSQKGAAMSEHAKGNAIDVGKIVLNNGKEILIRKKGFFAFREKGLLKAVRTDSCKYFTTVLGPGSDRFHKDHFHFDLRMRKSGYRHCSL
ncbi:extensin family protein [Rhizobium sp. ARZ01]|uniref:extensin-like domain-containing protein n=1 Tax=Rhizobium sp. ARZ01 TaxID=2769313 RepID=UPI00177DDFB2|nr:extensin family protein [Rhizobium sp. ARZ01]MBD9372192.1 extensin family protein [Rhizobium sp. ARZ01]